MVRVRRRNRKHAGTMPTSAIGSSAYSTGNGSGVCKHTTAPRTADAALEATTSRRGPGEGVTGAGEGTTCKKSKTSRREGSSSAKVLMEGKALQGDRMPCSAHTSAHRVWGGGRATLCQHQDRGPLTLAHLPPSSPGAEARAAATAIVMVHEGLALVAALPCSRHVCPLLLLALLLIAAAQEPGVRGSESADPWADSAEGTHHNVTVHVHSLRTRPTPHATKGREGLRAAHSTHQSLMS
jgi:hypothetical protein